MFPSGGKNFQDLQKQMQKIQKEIMKQQEELETKTWTASSGGGMVTVEINGKYVVQSVKLNKDVVNPDDIEMLEDLIVAALKEAHESVAKDAESSMTKLTGGIKIPGLF